MARRGIIFESDELKQLNVEPCSITSCTCQTLTAEDSDASRYFVVFEDCPEHGWLLNEKRSRQGEGE